MPLYQSKHTQSWYEKVGIWIQHLSYPWIKNQCAKIVLEHEVQSQHCLTIHILIWGHWEGQAAVECSYQSKHTQMWKVGLWIQHLFYPWIKNQHAKIVLEHEVQSQPYLTIQYTYMRILEGSSCCGMLLTIQTHTILMWKVGIWIQHLSYPWIKKSVCRDSFKA